MTILYELVPITAIDKSLDPEDSPQEKGTSEEMVVLVRRTPCVDNNAENKGAESKPDRSHIERMILE